MSFISIYGIPHISRQSSYLFCLKSTSWNILILSRGLVSSQGSTTLKMLQFFHRPYFSYPRKWSKIFLHRITTHKIQFSTNKANFIDSPMTKISCISITCLNSMPQYKGKMFSLLLLYFSQTQLIITSVLLLGTISGKVPCFITMETYYF